MKIKTKFKIIAIIAGLSFFAFNFSFAATTFFEKKGETFVTGDTFEVSYYLNTEGQDINAVEGVIVFPSELVLLKEIRDGNSVVNFWMQRPILKGGEVLFSGIIPGGYSSGKGYIFSLIFQAINQGEGLAQVKGIKILANDGKGTQVQTPTNGVADIVIGKVPPVLVPIKQGTLSLVLPTSTPVVSLAVVPEINDQSLPEVFEPKIVSDSKMFDGKYFLVFATQDKESGIDHYEVMEEKEQKFFNLYFVTDKTGWNETENTYVLNDQTLQSTIQVKAIDKAGNERISKIFARNPVKWFEVWWIWVVLLVVLTILCLVVVFVIRMLWKIKAKKE